MNFLPVEDCWQFHEKIIVPMTGECAADWHLIDDGREEMEKLCNQIKTLSEEFGILKTALQEETNEEDKTRILGYAFKRIRDIINMHLGTLRWKYYSMRNRDDRVEKMTEEGLIVAFTATYKEFNEMMAINESIESIESVESIKYRYKQVVYRLLNICETYGVSNVVEKQSLVLAYKHFAIYLIIYSKQIDEKGGKEMGEKIRAIAHSWPIEMPMEHNNGLA
jgi:hypothetical protein